MGDADGRRNAPDLPDATTNASAHARRRQFAAAFAAFPSPASVSSSAVNTPVLERLPIKSTTNTNFFSSRPRAPTVTTTPRNELWESAVSAEPDTICQEAVLTPPANDILEPGLNMIVGGALAPTHEARPTLPSRRSRLDLQLPSFDMLGIAAPHPDRYGLVPLESLPAGDLTPGSLELPEGTADLTSTLGGMKLESPLPAPAVRNPLSEKLPGTGVRSPAQYIGDPLTPPEEVPDIDWNHAALVDRPVAFADEQPLGRPSASEQSRAGAQNAQSGSGRPLSGPLGSGQSPLWFDSALHTIVDDLRSAPIPNSGLRILSHALPSPSPNGHVFTSVITAIQQETTAVESWINVFHAIPGRFNLADLPRSPPSTPGPAVGGTDYFTEKIFDSAVSIADYQEDLSQLPRSPRTVVPPSSVDISIVERYIPPTSSNEFKEMFRLEGQSILVDRLRELSTNNGSLLFIYPTKTGGQTFMREYLSPVLDPTLRTMGVVHGLSSSMATTLGGMAAVERLPDHAAFQHQLETLLARISHGGPAIERLFEQHHTPHLTLAYAARQTVMLDRATWASCWWTKQEKPRIREAVTRYAREAQTRSSNAHVERPRTSTELLQELLKGVAEKPYPAGQGPRHGIEVGVFVVKRSA
ncbi:uncharacterized protein LTR77_000886 [Saxophila tyrrhenica]|uniref:Uncharacterized protein n=1 Tax=Saxophila tyrrhenica TaxID=1690608 RepID=A0AAV9PS60_9PEZI|nr:hypothetical protein LTR77_000886 [Saxophila tyrrhenica]